MSNAKRHRWGSVQLKVMAALEDRVYASVLELTRVIYQLPPGQRARQMHKEYEMVARAVRRLAELDEIREYKDTVTSRGLVLWKLAPEHTKITGDIAPMQPKPVTPTTLTVVGRQ